MIGAIVGDIIGSRFEFNNAAAIGDHIVDVGASFTDETVCIVGLADAIMRKQPLDQTLRKWCMEYSWVSYGKMFWHWMRDTGAGPYNSFGNGCVARVSVANYFASSSSSAIRLCEELSALTHNHPESLRVVGLLSQALSRASESSEFAGIKTVLEGGGFNLNQNREILMANKVEFSEDVTQIVEPALAAVMVGKSFEDVMRICIHRGGDTDSICSLAGAFAEPLFGIPDEILIPAMEKVPAKMRDVLEKALGLKRSIEIKEGV
jgi:ADP-ribosyl-[dinitrogen reductase] hydrolase